MMWVSVNSHRARGKLRDLVGDLGPGHGSWPPGDWPHGEFYNVDEKHADAIRRIKGLRIMAREPRHLFQRISF